jgi:hypothetical protein
LFAVGIVNRPPTRKGTGCLHISEWQSNKWLLAFGYVI